MNTFDSEHIRNVALLGHSGSGKTTLAETMMFEAGVITRRGAVEERNTVSDYHEIEHERGTSIFGTLLHTEWKHYKINVIDTPGYDDFVGEVISALRVVDTGILLLSSPDGVEVGTELIWQYTEQFKTPMILVVNKIDHDKSDFNRTVEQARAQFGRAVIPVQYPLNEGTGFNTIVDVLKMTAYRFPADGGKPEKLPIPDSERDKANRLHNELIEAIAENDEGLMNLYFEKGSLDEDEMRTGLKKAMIAHQLFPLFCLSAKRNMGSGRLMGFIDNVVPSPSDMPAQKATNGTDILCDPQGPTVVFIYKTLSEPHVGDMSYFRVYSGRLRSGMDLVNSETGVTERIGHLFLIDGKKRTEVHEVPAGDIGATVKLKNTHANNTLHDKGFDVSIPPIVFPSPKVRTAIRPANTRDEEKLGSALHQLHEEDPTLVVEHSQELRQTLLYGQGELHFAVCRWRLQHRFGVDVEFIEPRIPYRETIQRSVKGHYRHKKQTGGAGQYGEVYMIVEPYTDSMPPTPHVSVRSSEEVHLPWGGTLVFQNCIVGGVIDTRFMPAIMKGVMEKMHNGPLTGSYVRDVRISVYDGSMHAVDSNDAAFKTAGMMAFKTSFLEADPKILEPIYEVEVVVPDDYIGDVMSDLPARRSIILGIDSDGHYQRVKARIPLVELDRYSTALRSMTQGRATYTSAFAEYAPVPPDIQTKLMAAHQAEQLAEA